MDLEALVADLSRRIENLIRTGTIAEVDHGKPPRVRVKTGGMLTTWLPWTTRRAGATLTWDPPTKGEQVMILSPSGELAAGVVIPALYSDAIDAPSHSPSEHVVLFPDGARLCYDHQTHHLDISGIETFSLFASGSGTVSVPKTAWTGDIDVDGDVISHGTVLHTHKHKDVAPGVATTGVPV